MELKRKLYVFSFTLLGLLIGLLLKNLVEIIYLKLLLNDFVTYSFGLTWDELLQYYFIFSLIVLALCGFWGYASGKYWWKQIYVLKKYGRKPWHLKI